MIDTMQFPRGEVVDNDPASAVAAFAEQVHQPDLGGVLFFCSSSYDREAIAAAMRARFDGPVVGCTTAGEIASTYQKQGIVGVSFPASDVRMHTRIIHDVQSFSLARAADLVESIRQDLVMGDTVGPDGMFGLLLIDGLSVAEEHVSAYLHHAFNGMAIVGGSAGDDLAFQETHVFAEGAFHRDAAVLTVFETSLPFHIFKWQHFEPTDVDLVVTDADPASRLVRELNGAPAADEYARILGCSREELGVELFSLHPVMIQVGEEWYVRSIHQMLPDGGLVFLSAIDIGVPLTIARPRPFVETLRQHVAELKESMSDIRLTIGCDCILRRIEMEGRGILPDVQQALEGLNFLGFSTYGEQINGIHVNQTLTGVVFGE